MIKFSFMSPGPGTYSWQCFVPCGLGWLFGNGGPMQTLGYMGGFMKVACLSETDRRRGSRRRPAAGSESADDRRTRPTTGGG